MLRTIAALGCRLRRVQAAWTGDAPHDVQAERRAIADMAIADAKALRHGALRSFFCLDGRSIRAKVFAAETLEGLAARVLKGR